VLVARCFPLYRPHGAAVPAVMAPAPASPGQQASGSAGHGLAIPGKIATARDATIMLTEAQGCGTRAVVTWASWRARPNRWLPPAHL